jgi:hypothetical protein
MNQPVTIANFSLVKIVLLAPVWLLMIFGPWWILFAPQDMRVYDRYGADMAHDFVTWVLLLLSPIGLMLLALMVRRLTYQNGEAIWISDGRLYYLPFAAHRPFRSFFCSLALNEVERFALGHMSGAYGGKGIIVHLKSGGQDEMPTSLMAQSRDVILERLNQALTASR